MRCEKRSARDCSVIPYDATNAGDGSIGEECKVVSGLLDFFEATEFAIESKGEARRRCPISVW
jgi:hypothetical protein